MNNIPKILYVMRDDGGCGYFRCKQPADFIKLMGIAETLVVMQTPTDDQLNAADLVVMQEMGGQNAVQIFEKLRRGKIPFVCEFDDFIHHVSPRNTWGFPAWNPGTLYIHRAMELARAASGITVSTPQLAREYFPYNENIYIVPNYLNKDIWDNPVAKRNDGKIRIGWMGGNAHADDLKMISKVIEKIVQKHAPRVMFETMGMSHQELGGVFNLEAYSDTCPSCGYQGTLRHSAGEPIDVYAQALSSKGWDIAVAPVINNSFGNCKSDLKLKEYAAARIATVASSVVPYKEAVDNGASVLLASSFEEWYNIIEDLIEHPEKRDDMVRRNTEWADRNWIQNHAQNIFEIYMQILSRAEARLGKRIRI